MNTETQGLRDALAQALELIPTNGVIGLGTGRAAVSFIQALGKRVREGLAIHAVPTSRATAELARELGISLVPLENPGQIDVTFDGADEIDPQMNLIKGLGGALVREKIVAAASKRLVILAGSEKKVQVLGSHGVLPVEVVPFALAICAKSLAAFGCDPLPRRYQGNLFVTDNGNNVLDCQVVPLADPADLERRILAIPGVVDTGLFLGMAHIALIFDQNGVSRMERPSS